MNSIAAFLPGAATSYLALQLFEESAAQKQGNNRFMYLAPYIQILSLTTLIVQRVAHKVAGYVATGFLATCISCTSLIAFFPIGYCLAVQSLYSSPMPKQHENRFYTHLFPQKTSYETRQITRFFTEHLDTVAKVIFSYSLFLLTLYEDLYYVGGSLLFLGIAKLIRMSCIPIKVRVFCAKYFNIFFQGVLTFVSPDIFTKILGVLEISERVHGLKQAIIYRIDSLARYYLKDTFRKLELHPGPSYVEIDKPYKKPTKADAQLTVEEIELLFDDKTRSTFFEPNPSYNMIKSVDIQDLPESSEFDKLLELFDEYFPKPTQKTYQIFLENLRFDNKFSQDMNRLCEEESICRGATTQKIDRLLQSIAASREISKEQFLQDYLRNKLKIFINNMSLKKRTSTGSDEKLLTAHTYTKKIVHYLLQAKDKQTIQFILYSLAETGGYCLLGYLRACKDILYDQILPNLVENAHSGATSPEKQIRSALQNLRRIHAHHFYYDLTGVLPGEISGDVHYYDKFCAFMPKGWAQSSNSFDVGVSMPVKLLYHLFPKNSLYKGYMEEIPSSISRVKRIKSYLSMHVGNCLKNWYSPKEQEIIHEKLFSQQDKIEAKMIYLFCLFIGALRKRKNPYPLLNLKEGFQDQRRSYQTSYKKFQSNLAG